MRTSGPDERPAFTLPGTRNDLLWTRRYDPFAEFAVRSLNHALQIRWRNEVAAVDSGVMEWLLHEDPDLATLREHLRFQRWASSTFAATGVTSRTSDAARKAEERFRTLRRRRYRNDGIFGADLRWRNIDRLWWLANDYFLVESLGGVAGPIAAEWRLMADRADATTSDPGGELRLLTDFARRMRQDAQAWRRLSGYRRFAARTDLRLQLGRDLARLANHSTAQRSFPVTGRVLADDVHLDYEKVDDFLKLLVDEATECETRSQALVRNGRTRSVDRLIAAEARRAAARWEALIDDVTTTARQSPANQPGMRSATDP